MSPSRTVFVSGIFNVLHPGHVRLLRFARELGTRLIVGIIPDSLAGASITVGERSRLESIQSLRMVDDSFIIEGSVIEAIMRIRPDVVVKGREHLNEANEEAPLLESYGGRLVFSSGDSFFSSVDLIRNELEVPHRLPIDLPLQFMSDHGISRDRLLEILWSLGEVRVLVVGDSIVDQYVSCHPLGMSREDPTLVVTPIDSETFAGGAAIVAAHAASLGASARLHTITGSDAEARFLAEELRSLGVQARLHVDDNRPTTMKQRWRAGGKTLLRVSHLQQEPMPLALQRELAQEISACIKDYDVLIFSDFNYGALPSGLVDHLATLGRDNGLTMAADSQASSQVSDISRFVGMTLITPTEYEARLAVRNFEDGLVVLADKVRRIAQAKIVILTLAEDGVFLRGAIDPSTAPTTERLPALNRSPVDVAGAGDSLLVITAMALSKGASVYEAALLGSLAAAVQVSAIGNRPLRLETLAGLLQT